MNNYLAAYDIRQPDAIVKCPCCNREQTIDRESIDNNNWIAHCGCGAVFGVVAPERFAKYVSMDWFKGNTPNGTIAYCDFIIREVNTANGLIIIRRWHGWVDADSRQIVQVG
jgi:hypothetical protein